MNIPTAAQNSDPTWRAWNPRRFRKNLRLKEAEISAAAKTFWRIVWAPDDLNWWIGTLFAIGSLHFALGSVLGLERDWAQSLSLWATGVNAIFFVGSLFFTSAAFLQLNQAANSLLRSSGAARARDWVGWYPGDMGWQSCALQFVGTVLFNINTFDAMIPSLSWWERDLAIWVPDFIGSILFLISGYLAFVEMNESLWGWKPKSVSWWVTTFNLLGCVGFMGSAVFAITLPGPNVEAVAIHATELTLIGAVCFFGGSCLMLPEAQSDPEA